MGRHDSPRDRDRIRAAPIEQGSPGARAADRDRVEQPDHWLVDENVEEKLVDDENIDSQLSPE